MSDIRDNIAQQIKAYRSYNKWTQEDLAFHSNVQQSTLSDLETGKTYITVPTLEKLCKAFKITISEFYDFSKLYQTPEHASLEAELMYYCKNFNKTQMLYLIKFAKTIKD